MPIPPQENIEKKLDAILFHMERMDRRDRWRTFGGFFRSIISLIPIIILVWSTWYFIVHKDEIFRDIIKMSAQATMDSARNIEPASIQRMMEQYTKPR